MDFESLGVWKRSITLSVEIVKKMENVIDKGFKDQITRSSLSVPSNIAEGMERETNPDKVKFLIYAKGSAAELRTQVYIGVKIGYIEPEAGNLLIQECKEISAMLHGLIKSLKK